MTSIYDRTAIKTDAERARKLGQTPNDACPYPFYSPAGLHWVACWNAAGLPTKDPVLLSDTY